MEMLRNRLDDGGVAGRDGEGDVGGGEALRPGVSGRVGEGLFEVLDEAGGDGDGSEVRVEGRVLGAGVFDEIKP